MAKRKGRRTIRKKRNDSSSFLAEIKRMIIAAVLVVLCFILLLYAYNYFCSPGSDNENRKAKKEKVMAEMDTAPENADKETISPSDTKTFRIPAGLELPRLTINRQEQIIKHDFTQTRFQKFSGNSSSNSIGMSLSERSRCVLNATHNIQFRVSGCNASPLTEVFKLINSEFSG